MYFLSFYNEDLIAGHSKWKNTKYCKVIQDMKRGKMFIKFVCNIETVTKLSGVDIVHNSRLWTVL